ncbi:MAG: hypothetical protein HGA22_15035 [Clostridiales bacterium]|nr:hypothetical protein [Clostridiales bacterium]
MVSTDDLYSNKIILNAVLPLLKVLIESKKELGKGFAGKNAVVQFSARSGNAEGADTKGNGTAADGIAGNSTSGDNAAASRKVAMHFVIEAGEITVKRGAAEKPDVDFEFKGIEEFNAFFKGKSSKLPKIIGLRHLGIVIPTFKALMTMSKVLGAVKAPEAEADKDLLVKMFFYLLTSGISQLNKSGHPEISKWVLKSPDRVYAFAVTGKPELSAFIRVKAGNSKASRGEYTRSKPFYTMRFSDTDAALGILLETDDMLESTAKEKLIMEGAPEFGAQIGEYMKLVGSYIK